jgi:hypothetical protein
MPDSRVVATGGAGPCAVRCGPFLDLTESGRKSMMRKLSKVTVAAATVGALWAATPASA